MDKWKEYLDEYYELTKESSIKNSIESSKELLKDITTVDSLFTAVIKGHLIIESKLEKLLIDYGFNERLLEKKFFSDKLNLCIGIGIINQDIANPLNKINATRNKYGHDINFKITEEYLDTMISSLSKSDKDMYDNIIIVRGYNNHEGDEFIYKRVLAFIETVFYMLKTAESILDYKKATMSIRWYRDVIRKINEHNKKTNK